LNANGVKLLIDVYNDIARRLKGSEYIVEFEYSVYCGDVNEWNMEEFNEEEEVIEWVAADEYGDTRFAIARNKKEGWVRLFEEWRGGNKTSNPTYILIKGLRVY
jgi:hypothetical protein